MDHTSWPEPWVCGGLLVIIRHIRVTAERVDVNVGFVQVVHHRPPSTVHKLSGVQDDVGLVGGESDGRHF